MRNLPPTGFLRLVEIIGREEVTEDQARANARRNEEARERAIAEGRLDVRGNPVFDRLPARARPAIPRLIPVAASSWWAGVKLGKFPKPIKLSPGVTVWRVEEIRDLIERA